MTQEDYYRLLACFTPVYDPGRWKLPAERCLPDVPPGAAKAIALRNAAIDRRIQEVRKAGVAARGRLRARADSKHYAALPAAIRADLRGALSVSAGQRNEVQKYLAEKLGPLVHVNDGGGGSGAVGRRESHPEEG